MKHNNDTYYSMEEFNTAIDNELKRWLEILASYNDDRKLKKSFKKDFQNAYNILEPFASSYYLDSSVKADEKYNHVLWDMKINQLKNFLPGYSYEELQCMCKYCMNYFLKERIKKIVHSHGEPNHTIVFVNNGYGGMENFVNASGVSSDTENIFVCYNYAEENEDEYYPVGFEKVCISSTGFYSANISEEKMKENFDKEFFLKMIGVKQ